ncbi:MAG: hypothetical protein ACXWYO_06640 [Gaiellaceae bacterium]
MSRLLFLRPHRPEMPFVAADPAVVSGIMTPEIRPLRLSVR